MSCFFVRQQPASLGQALVGRRNDNDHQLCCEFSLVRVFTVSLGETSAYTHLQDEAQEQTPLQLLHLKGISSPQTANKELQISSR